MINNKRGLSGVVVSLITVLLAIVAIGIVWTVIAGIMDKNSDSIDINNMCQGALIKIDSVTYEMTTEANPGATPPTGEVGICTVTIKRLPGVSEETMDGVSIAIGENSESEDGNIALTKSIKIGCAGEPTEATARAYFTINEEDKYCSTVEWTA